MRGHAARSTICVASGSNQKLNSWRGLVALVLPGLLASCGGWDHDDNCFNCGPPQQQTEISLGVVSADFNKDGFPDVVALSTDTPALGPNASNLNTYLSIAAGEIYLVDLLAEMPLDDLWRRPDVPLASLVK